MLKKTESLDCTFRCPKLNAALHLLHPMSRNPEHEDTTRKTGQRRGIHATDFRSYSNWESFKKWRKMRKVFPPRARRLRMLLSLTSCGSNFEDNFILRRNLKLQRLKRDSGLTSRCAARLLCAPVAPVAPWQRLFRKPSFLPVCLPNPRPIYPTRPLHPQPVWQQHGRESH